MPLKADTILYGAENQAEIYYAGPVKNGLYDMLAKWRRR